MDEDELSSQEWPPVEAVEAIPGPLHRHLDHNARRTWPLQLLQWDTNVIWVVFQVAVMGK